VTLTIPDIDPEAGAMAAAFRYVNAGLYIGPIKHGSKHPGSVLDAGHKRGGGGETWPSKTFRDSDSVAAHFSGTDYGVFWHIGRSGLTVLDVDAPEKVPAEWWPILDTAPFQSTREGDDRRGHYVFATPPGRIISNATGSSGRLGWGEVRGTNGIIVVAPTRHEKADQGGRYQWERTGPVPVLPPLIADTLPEGKPGEAAVTDEAVTAFMAAHTEALAPERLHEAATSDFCTLVAKGESRHGSAVTAACWLAREAASGWYPARESFLLLRDTFAGTFTPGERRKGRGGDVEFTGVAAWAIGQVKPEDIVQKRAELAALAPETTVATTLALPQGIAPSVPPPPAPRVVMDLSPFTAPVQSPAPVQADPEEEARLVAYLHQQGWADEEIANRRYADHGADLILPARLIAQRKQDVLLAAEVEKLERQEQAKAIVRERRRQAASEDAEAQMLSEVLSSAELDDVPDLEPLVDGWLWMDTLFRIVGASASFKSFVVVDLLCHIAAGRDWWGYRVAKGPVLYMPAEGARGVRKRVRAWEIRNNGGRRLDGLHILPRPIQVTGDEWMAFVAVCRQLGVRAIVLDTQARVTVGVEENSATQNSEVVAMLEELRTQTGAACGLVHHTGHVGDKGRGSTAIFGALQSEISVKRLEKTRVVEVKAAKQKDEDELGPVRFKMDDCGDSLVMEHIGAGDIPEAAPSLQPTAAEAVSEGRDHKERIGRLMHILFSGGRGATKDEILRAVEGEYVKAGLLNAKKPRLSKSSWGFAWTAIEKADWLEIGVTSTRFVLSEKGCQELGLEYEPPVTKGGAEGRADLRLVPDESA
jgi:hypothetical protein